MPEPTVVCPHCKRSFELTQAMSAPIEARLRAKYEAETRAAEEQVAARERALAKQAADLARQKESIDELVDARLSAERAKLREAAEAKAREAVGVELKAAQEEAADTRRKLEEAGKRELALRQERNKLDEEKRELALTVQRTLDEERDQIRAAALKQADEQHRLKLAESEKKLADVTRQLEEARRKAEQGSQQGQGEVLEIELEQILRSAFPFDLVEPVPKGVHGGDVLQRVRNEMGQVCGTILWESKRTKAWSDGWLPKLRDDGRTAKADAFALMTMTMPKDVCNFANVDGVWVTNRDCVLGVAAALRAGIVQVAGAKRAIEGQHGKKELVYQYLMGPQFLQRAEGIVEALRTMKEELDAEKRALTKIWAKREKQIERAALNAIGMHGDLAGIVGGELPELTSLQLPAPSEQQELA